MVKYETAFRYLNVNGGAGRESRAERNGLTRDAGWTRLHRELSQDALSGGLSLFRSKFHATAVRHPKRWQFISMAHTSNDISLETQLDHNYMLQNAKPIKYVIRDVLKLP